MKFTIKYNNIEAEFEAGTKEEIWAAETLFKTAAYTFREDEIKSSMEIYRLNSNMKNKKPSGYSPDMVTVQQESNRNRPATEKQIKCLRARHIRFDPNITMGQAYELIQRSDDRRF